MITSMRGCVAHNDLWSRPISSRWFSHDFVVKLLNYVTSRVRSTAHTVVDGFFLYLAQMITSMREGIPCNKRWSWPIPQGHLAILPCPLYSMYCYRWILSLFGTNYHKLEKVCCKQWYWPISSRLFSCHIAYCMNYIHIWHKYNPWGDGMVRIISWSRVVKGQGHTGHSHFFAVGEGGGVFPSR